MQRSSRVLALIPARSGSKGIVGKNLKPLDGKPLLAHSIECAFRVPAIDRVVVSTESETIAEAARQWGAEVPYLRPAHLAEDTTPMLDVVIHALETLAASGWVADVIALLQPTAPFRRAEDLTTALAVLENELDVDSVVTVETVPDHFSPYYLMKVEEGLLLPFMQEGAMVTRRQDAPRVYSRNGQFYLARAHRVIADRSLYGPVSRAFITDHPAVNLDEPNDWAEAEQLAARTGVLRG